jgi:hypothetical protein
MLEKLPDVPPLHVLLQRIRAIAEKYRAEREWIKEWESDRRR